MKTISSQENLWKFLRKVKCHWYLNQDDSSPSLHNYARQSLLLNLARQRLHSRRLLCTRPHLEFSFWKQKDISASILSQLLVAETVSTVFSLKVEVPFSLQLSLTSETVSSKEPEFDWISLSINLYPGALLKRIEKLAGN